MRRWWLAAALACAPAPRAPVGPEPAPVTAPAEAPAAAEVPPVSEVPEDMSPGTGPSAPVPQDSELLVRETASAKPGINDPYRKAGAAKTWSRRFERDGREVHDRRAEIVRALGLRPGMAIADVGAGTGLFTLAFAEAVGPGGTVYAVDVIPGFLAHIRAKVEKAGLQQVKLVQATDRSSELPPGSVDAIFTSDAYHHFEYPQHTLASLKAALRPGGTLWLIDFRREETSDAWLKQHVRAGQAVVLQELAAAGFVLVEELPLLRENYFLKLQLRAP